jgi:anti-sigma factor RsiW
MVVKCEQVWQEISNYLEGEVNPDLRAAMEAHFHECKRCTALLDGTRNVIHLYGDDRSLQLPAGFTDGWRDWRNIGWSPGNSFGVVASGGRAGPGLGQLRPGSP